MWSAPAAVAAATVPSVLPSSTMSHSTQSNPSTRRGSAASVVPIVDSSLRQGIWITSFRRAPASVPTPPRRGTTSLGRDESVACAAPERLLVSLEAFIPGTATALRYIRDREGKLERARAQITPNIPAVCSTAGTTSQFPCAQAVSALDGRGGGMDVTFVT